MILELPFIHEITNFFINIRIYFQMSNENRPSMRIKRRRMAYTDENSSSEDEEAEQVQSTSNRRSVRILTNISKYRNDFKMFDSPR